MNGKYAIIDNFSGFFWGQAEAEDAMNACRALDTEIAPGDPAQYERCYPHDLAANESGYHVYQISPELFAWLAGQDGQDQTVVDRIEAEGHHEESFRTIRGDRVTDYFVGKLRKALYATRMDHSDTDLFALWYYDNATGAENHSIDAILKEIDQIIDDASAEGRESAVYEIRAFETFSGRPETYGFTFNMEG